jgi:hypothetical protein
MRAFLRVFALVTVGISSAGAQEFPIRRAGLWEVTINREGVPPQVMQQCTDAKTDRLMTAYGSGIGAELCSKQEMRKVGATLVIDATCKIGPMTAISQSVVSGDFNSNYTVTVTSKVQGVPAAAAALAGGATTIRARWVGACKPGQRPGDIVMPGGKTMNIDELKKMLDGRP